MASENDICLGKWKPFNQGVNLATFEYYDEETDTHLLLSPTSLFTLFPPDEITKCILSDARPGINRIYYEGIIESFAELKHIMQPHIGNLLKS